jgi:hypothetical protein
MYEVSTRILVVAGQSSLINTGGELEISITSMWRFQKNNCLLVQSQKKRAAV